MVIFDANMILRYVLNDSEEMADVADKYIAVGDVYVTLEVMAEVVYVLHGPYGMNREQIFNAVMDFLKLVNCEEKIVLYLAMETYKRNNLDFVDCILFAYNRLKGAEIATFDKKTVALAWRLKSWTNLKCTRRI